MTPRFATWRRLVSGCALLLASVAAAQEEPVPTVHWAYASSFGTGWYTISDRQRAFIANLAPPLVDYSRMPARQVSRMSSPSSISSSLIVSAGRNRMTFPFTPQDNSTSPCS